MLLRLEHRADRTGGAASGLSSCVCVFEGSADARPAHASTAQHEPHPVAWPIAMDAKPVVCAGGRRRQQQTDVAPCVRIAATTEVAAWQSSHTIPDPDGHPTRELLIVLRTEAPRKTEPPFPCSMRTAARRVCITPVMSMSSAALSPTTKCPQHHDYTHLPLPKLPPPMQMCALTSMTSALQTFPTVQCALVEHHPDQCNRHHPCMSTLAVQHLCIHQTPCVRQESKESSRPQL